MTELAHWSVLAAIGIVVLAIVLRTSLRTLREHQRGVVFRLGRVQAVKEPGVFFLLPLLQRMVVVDLRPVSIEVPAQAVRSRDHVALQVGAAIAVRIVDPEKAVTKVDDARAAISRLAQTTLGPMLGQYDLNEIMAERDMRCHDLRLTLNRHAEPWGIEVSGVTFSRFDLDDATIRALEQQAQAERLHRAQGPSTTSANTPAAQN